MTINHQQIPKKILFFPDLINSEDSGARSARSTLKNLIDLGFEVAVFATDVEKSNNYFQYDSCKLYKIESKMSAVSHFWDIKLLQQFKKIISEFRPDFFFMAGSIQKPSILASFARKAGIKNIFLFYINDYYCAKTYAGLNNGPCFKCIDLGLSQALNNNCIKRDPKLINFYKSLLVMKRLQFEMKNSYKVLGYTKDQIDIYKRIGITNNKCSIINYQFDPNELNNINTKEGDYFLIIGQPILEKGWHTLSEIITNCKSDIKIKIIFKNLEVENNIIKKYKLEKHILNGTITTLRNITERYEIIKYIAESKGMIIPSYYPTTGEFVLLESLVLGKPVLVFNAGAHKELIIHEKNGMVAEIGDFNNFASNIDRINTDSNLLKNISSNAREAAKKIFSQSNNVKLLNVFK